MCVIYLFVTVCFVVVLFWLFDLGVVGVVVCRLFNTVRLRGWV